MPRYSKHIGNSIIVRTFLYHQGYHPPSISRSCLSIHLSQSMPIATCESIQPRFCNFNFNPNPNPNPNPLEASVSFSRLCFNNSTLDSKRQARKIQQNPRDFITQACISSYLKAQLPLNSSTISQVAHARLRSPEQPSVITRVGTQSAFRIHPSLTARESHQPIEQFPFSCHQLPSWASLLRLGHGSF